jgi:hypothetical protein
MSKKYDIENKENVRIENLQIDVGSFTNEIEDDGLS